jgi:hypothetical protein
VLAEFDLNSVSVGFDGFRVWAAPCLRRALNGHVNVADGPRQSTTYETRLFKYAIREFAVALPGLQPKRVQP